ncbi:MAG: hypothetical protein JW740_00500 [Candidatus Zambryskibacteria bacterium]|nr:hypothetical protein [Candidatus Zambryskibacteria bacterium]
MESVSQNKKSFPEDFENWSIQDKQKWLEEQKNSIISEEIESEPKSTLENGIEISKSQEERKEAPNFTENRLLSRQSFQPVLEESQIEASPKSSFEHKVVSGDSVWNFLKEDLNEFTEKFSELTETQKSYTLRALTNKLFQDPAKYGLGGDTLRVGNKLDLSELFRDADKINNLLQKARDIIKPGSAREDIDLENDRKISDWVKAHPNEALIEDKVPEILNPKPETAVEIKTEKPAFKLIADESLIKKINKTPELRTDSTNKEVKFNQAFRRTSYGY